MEDSELGAGRTCFVVSPIGDRLEPVGSEGRLRYEQAINMWENVFEPACAQFGLTAVRADKIAEPGEIPKQIFTYLKDADVVIADVTGGNANVMYELGLRHTRNKVTIQVGEHQRLPFDVNTIRTIQFKRTDAGLIDARDALVESLRASLAGQYKPVSATEVWNTLETLSADDVRNAANASSAPDDDPEFTDEDGPGRLEQLVVAEEAMGELASLLAELGQQITDAGTIATESTPLMQASKSFAQKLAATRKFAARMLPIAARMDDTSERYFARIEQVDVMSQMVARELEEDGFPEEADDRASMIEYLESMVSLAESAADGRSGMSDMRASVRELRRLSKELVPVSKSMEQSLNRVIAGTDVVISWGELVRPLLEQVASTDSAS